MRKLFAGLALILLGIPANQISNVYDFRVGIAAAVTAAVIGYGLMLTSDPAKVYIWQRAARAGRRGVVVVILLTGLVTGLLGAGVAWLLVRQAADSGKPTESLRGTIDGVAVGDYTLETDPTRKIAIVLMTVTIRNAGAPTIVDSYRMVMKYANGVAVPGQSEEIPSNFTVSHTRGEREEIYGRDSLSRKTMQPIATGAAQQGRLMYSLQGITAQDIRGHGDTFEFSYSDATGRRYTVVHKLKNPEMPIGPSTIQGWPGLTPPSKPAVEPATPTPVSAPAPKAEAISGTPPIRVEIQGSGYDPKAPMGTLWGPFGTAPLGTFTFKVHILNTSRERRVSLHFASLTTATTVHVGPLKTEGLKFNLGPEEETEGIVKVGVSESEMKGQPVILRVLERLSDRYADVPVPGRFPPKPPQK